MPAPAPPAPHVLREYALLADGERGALIGPGGDIAWMCFPRWHDPAPLAGLLGARGQYVVRPEGRHVWGGSYEDGTLTWRSRWVLGEAVVECREALALPSGRDRAVLLRQVRCLQGEARVQLALELAAGYGEGPADALGRDEDGTWRGRLGGTSFAWAGAPEAAVDDAGVLRAVLTLRAGDAHDLVLALDATGEASPPDPGVAWRETEAGWEGRVPTAALASSFAPRDARQAYAVLTGLTSATGAMVAAPTTSLPERADAGTSYDYRYAWIRDQCLAGQAVARTGPHPLLDAAVSFVSERLLADGAQLMPAYTVDGGRVPDQRHVGLPGYPGGSDVVGNHVNAQFQLDAFGEALLLLARADELGVLDADGWRAARVAVRALSERWREPDAGIWELSPAQWTHSKLIGAAGLRAVARRPTAGAEAGSWLALADEISAHVAATSTHPSGRWQRAADDPGLDGALLLLPLRGAVAPDDPRTLATLAAYEAQLCEDHYAYRFRHDARPLGEAEGSFLLCGSLMALALHQQGRHVDAARWFERTRSSAGSPGLLTEEIDVQQRQLRGNLPQAFVHAMLLEAAVVLGAG